MLDLNDEDKIAEFIVGVVCGLMPSRRVGENKSKKPRTLRYGVLLI